MFKKTQPLFRVLIFYLCYRTIYKILPVTHEHAKKRLVTKPGAALHAIPEQNLTHVHFMLYLNVSQCSAVWGSFSHKIRIYTYQYMHIRVCSYMNISIYFYDDVMTATVRIAFTSPSFG